VRSPRAVETKGQQNESSHSKFLILRVQQILRRLAKSNSMCNTDSFKFIIYVNDGHCDCSPRTPKKPTPLSVRNTLAQIIRINAK
jgi:hypothetical protein